MSTFNQGVSSVPVILNSSNVRVFGNTSSGNALSVQQLGAGNVFVTSNTNGTVGLFVNHRSNVGVGTNNPQQYFHISSGNIGGIPTSTGTGSDSNVMVRYTWNSIVLDHGCTNDGTVWMQSRQPSTSLGTTYPLVLNPIGGKVGIGTTSPQNLLHIMGEQRFQGLAGGTTPADYWKFYHNANASNDFGFLFANATTTAMTFKSSGSGINVGIGTVSPTDPLTVQALNTQATFADLSLTTPNSKKFSILYQNLNGVGGMYWSTFLGKSLSTDGTNFTIHSDGANRGMSAIELGYFGVNFYSNIQTLATTDQTGITPTALQTSRVMTIQGVNGAAGRVGIGTASPTQPFHCSSIIPGGSPANSGAASDPNATSRVQMGSVVLDTGALTNGSIWLQCRSKDNYATNYAMLLNPNGGVVGIGTASPSYPLHVVGSSGRAAAFKYLTYSSAPNWTADSFSIALGALVNSCIATNDAFVVFSDSRIKIEEQAPQSYLALVNNIDVKNFSYIDKVQYGPRKKIGFFAQQVETVLPDAVSKIPDFIPNIFRKCSASGNCVTVDNHGIAEGAKVRIMSGGERVETTVHVLDENTVQVDAVLENEVFVFGTEVDDFRVLNNDYMSAVAFGGLKELHALVKTQQTTIEMLTERLAAAGL
jgi:hypothetical protein